MTDLTLVDIDDISPQCRVDAHLLIGLLSDPISCPSGRITRTPRDDVAVVASRCESHDKDVDTKSEVDDITGTGGSLATQIALVVGRFRQVGVQHIVNYLKSELPTVLFVLWAMPC